MTSPPPPPTNKDLPPLPNLLLTPFNLSLTPTQFQSLAFALLGLFIFLVLSIRVFIRSSKSAYSSSTAPRTVVLCGPMGGGKTRVWSRMVMGRETATVTSMVENSGVVAERSHTLGGEEKSNTEGSAGKPFVPLSILDTPGHPRLRTSHLSKSLPTSTGLIFVLPTTALSGRPLRDATDHLHLVLSSLHLLASHPKRTSSTRMPPLLILVTGGEKGVSGGVQVLDRAKAAVARELQRRRSPALGGGMGHAEAGRGALEGLEAVPTTSSSSSWFSFASLLQPKASVGLSADGKREVLGLPEEEGEVLAQVAEIGGEVGLDGDNVWEGGVRWAVRGEDSDGSAGLGDVWEWIEGL